jgi:LysR family nitrogen assimilation transcriptional regulator
MDFQDLHAFAHVAKLGSFSRAAAQLRVAQSALSRRVARLEHRLGTTLLTRHGRGARPTEAGTVLLARAEELTHQLGGIERDLARFSREPRGHVRVAITPTTGQMLAPPLVAECRARFPGITLLLREGVTGYIHEWLAQGDVDLAILYDPEPSADIAITPLVEEPLYLVCPPGAQVPLSQDGSFSLRDLHEVKLVLPQRSHSIRLLLEQMAARYGVTLDIALEVEGMRTTKALVQSGIGFTVFSFAGIYEEVEVGTLRGIPIKPRLSWRMSLAERRASSDSRAQIAVRQLIQAQVHTLLDRGLWRGHLIGMPSPGSGASHHVVRVQ